VPPCFERAKSGAMFHLKTPEYIIEFILLVGLFCSTGVKTVLKETAPVLSPDSILVPRFPSKSRLIHKHIVKHIGTRVHKHIVKQHA
jgi:hypothetical protein